MPMRRGTPMPALDGATEWVNGAAVTDDFKGKPTLVHFWSVSCGSCHEIMDSVKEWRERFGDQGLEFVGIHMPRGEKDTNVDAVKTDLAEMDVTWPNAIDNRHAIVDAFENKFVPAFYLFNEAGEMTHFQAGDRGQKMLEAAIERVLKPKAPVAEAVAA
jgi:thiol-disulfide isomerase/thioredoxin